MTPPFDRRRFLKSLGLGLAAVTAPGCGETSSGVALAEPVDFPLGLDLPFAHGVASGDPLADRVILIAEGRVRFDGPPADLRRDGRSLDERFHELTRSA